MTDTGHWVFDYDFDPDDWFGFVYRITEIHSGRMYIGKKQFFSTRRVKVKNRKNRKVVIKDSDWKSYTGSSKHLNSAIEEYGKDNYTFSIESLHETKGSLYYQEVKMQIEEDVMLSTFDDGTPKYYNKQVGAVKFKVPPVTLNEQKVIDSKNLKSTDVDTK
jgi:hypothetical protein